MKWILEKRKIRDLYANHKNPRRLSKKDAEQLEKSLDKFGLCEPIVINPDGAIIGGHQRIRVLKKMGHTEVEVYVPDTALSEAEEAELNIRLNKNLGDWDFDVLANCWDASELVEWGFSMEELHLESMPDNEGSDEQTPTKRATMTISFMDADHLQEAENEIATIVDAYKGASYKVKVI